MSTETIPSANDAEQALIGCLLLDAALVGELSRILMPGDFFVLRAQRAYAAMLDLHAGGDPVDIVTVSAALSSEADATFLLECMNVTPAISRARHYAELVVDASVRRKALMAGSSLVKSIREGLPTQLVREEAVGLLRDLSEGGTAAPHLLTLAEIMAAEDPNADWLIPHICTRRQRTVIVAGEGVGKATLMRQIGLHVAAGRDPFDPLMRIDPIRVLYIDAENPVKTIQRQTRLANRQHALGHEAADRYVTWHCEDGLDLRSRTHRLAAEAAIRDFHPDVVLAGPLYKLFRRGHAEDMEQATIEFCQVMDDLRVRFDFALFLEHHAPKGEGGSRREMSPFGSSALLRWPDAGITLEDRGEAKSRPMTLTIDVGRFRADRLPLDWPDHLTRGSQFSNIAWAPAWDQGRGKNVGARWTTDGWDYYEAI